MMPPLPVLPSRQPLADAMIAGMKRAGFVNVTGREEKGPVPDTVCVVVQGDCPCGLGTSQLTRLLDRRWTHGLSRQRLAEELEHSVYHQALDHIEQDKKEGRWK